MVDACTGVILVNPILEMASRTHADKEGLSALHNLDDPGFDLGSSLSEVMPYSAFS